MATLTGISGNFESESLAIFIGIRNFDQMNKMGKNIHSDVGPYLSYPSLPPNPNLASEFKIRIESWIMGFLNQLDSDKEVGIAFVNFGPSHIIRLEEVRFSNPSLITFKGEDEAGNLVEVIQHVSQINVMLKQIPIDDSAGPRRRIGFFEEVQNEEETN